jgi:uncharacterized protein YjiS (DUF1127 family)
VVFPNDPTSLAEEGNRLSKETLPEVQPQLCQTTRRYEAIARKVWELARYSDELADAGTNDFRSVMSAHH